MVQEPHGTESSEENRGKSLRGQLDEIKMIAVGGMSQIFRARQPTLDRYIAVKRLKDELLSHAETRERFRREAKALASVLHQNIAHVYDFVESHDEPYLLMEYIEGIDVSQAIEKVGQLPPRVAAAILLGVAKGVSYIHQHHLIHRDIKPSNIRLNRRGEVKLMDFGIVIDLGNEGLTRPGVMVGSPSYLSPEQVLGNTITPQADLFLLGICLYEMLTGTRPFKEEGNETVFQRIREVRYVPARRMQPTIPAALDSILAKCLRKDPLKRFASAKELIGALERYLGPGASSHTEDIILKYLDEEALLEPSVPYAEVQDRRPRIREALSVSQRVGLAIAALTFIAAAFYGGYRWGSRGIVPAPPAGAVAFPPAKAAGTKPFQKPLKY